MTQSERNEILERLARIEEKVDANASHDERIRNMEKWQAGLAAIIVFVTIEMQAIGIVVALLRFRAA